MSRFLLQPYLRRLFAASRRCSNPHVALLRCGSALRRSLHPARRSGLQKKSCGQFTEYEQKAFGEAASPHAQCREAALSALLGMGIDVANPTELQADLYYLRRLRKAGEEMRSVLRHALLTLVVSTVLYLLWEAVKLAVWKG